MKVLFLILFLAISSTAQQFVGTSADIIYYIDKVEKKSDSVTFIGLASRFYKADGEFLLDKNNYQTSEFTANCKTYEWSQSKFAGRTNGQDVISDIKVTGKTQKPQILFWAIEMACTGKSIKELQQPLSKFDG